MVDKFVASIIFYPNNSVHDVNYNSGLKGFASLEELLHWSVKNLNYYHISEICDTEFHLNYSLEYFHDHGEKYIRIVLTKNDRIIAETKETANGLEWEWYNSVNI